jgi:hypothetical protein
MALVPQEIEIGLNLGMDTKQSDELQAPSSMRLVENLHWRGQGQIEKRPAHDVSAAIAEPTGSLYDEADACGLVTRDKSPIVVTGKHGLAVYSSKVGAILASPMQFTRARDDVANSPSTTGTLNYCPVSYDVSRRFVERSQGNSLDAGVFHVASAQYNGVHVIAWITSGTTFRLCCKAISADTGETVATTEYDAIASSANALMVQACEYTESGKEGVLIAYVDDAASPYTVSTIRWNYATNQFVADSALATNAVTQTFAIVKNGTRIYFAYHDSSSGFLKVEDRTIGSISSTHTATHGALGVDIVVGASRTLIVSCTATTAYAEVFGQAAASTSIAASSEEFFKVTAAAETRTATSDDAVWLITSLTSTAPYSTRVRVYEVNYTTDTPTTPNTLVLPHCVTVANAFTLRSMAHAVLVVYDRVNTGASDGSPKSCYVARFRSNGTGWIRMDAVAKLAHDRFYATNRLSYDATTLGPAMQGNSAYVDSSNNAWLALTADPSPDFAPDRSGFHYPQSIFLARISAARPMPMAHVEPEPGVVFSAGGVPWEFDGDAASEASALCAPVAIVDVSSGTGRTGTFGIIPMYKWIDAAGRIHRMPGSAVSTGAIVNKQIDVYVSKCPMRAYGHASSVALDMEPELYITEDDGSTYYLAQDPTGGGAEYFDSSTSDGLWYKFTNVFQADTSMSPYPFGSAPLELSPEPTPAFFHVAKVVDRLWAIDAEDRTRIWYSKPLVAEYAVEWCTSNTLTIGDQATAVVDMGGGACILARNGIYLVDGEGPDATGAGGFAPARKLNHAVDCIDPVSVCRTPLGVVFRGRRGFYLLDNGFQAQPFGVPIDPEILTDPALDPSVSSSYRMRVVYQEQTSEIHICGVPGSVSGSSGHRLVYNILEQKWSRYAVPSNGGAASTLEDVRDLAVVRGKAWRMARVNGADLLRGDNLYSHESTYNVEAVAQMQIDTPWYRLDEVNGMVRLWRAWFAFKLPSDIADVATFTIRYYVDNNDTVAQTVTFTGSELATIFSTTSEVARLPFQPNVQVVRSFRFSLQWATTGTASAGPKPLSMRLQFGVRPSKGKQSKTTVKG